MYNSLPPTRMKSTNMVQLLQSRLKSKPAAVDSKATTPPAVQNKVILQASDELSQKRVEEMAKILSEQIQPSASDQKPKATSSTQPVVSADFPKVKSPQTSQQKAQTAASGPNPKTTVSMQSAIPADPPKAASPQASQDKSQQRIKAIAEKLQTQSAEFSKACAALPTDEELEELYRAIDEQAALLAPDEQTCYTAQGQQALLDAAMHALPQLTMLNAPGFPGDRIRHAVTGAEAYQAMVDLTNSMRQLVQEMDRSQIEAVLAGISQEDALMAWKAFRFYTNYVGDRGFALVLEQLAWAALG